MHLSKKAKERIILGAKIVAAFAFTTYIFSTLALAYKLGFFS